ASRHPCQRDPGLTRGVGRCWSPRPRGARLPDAGPGARLRRGGGGRRGAGARAARAREGICPGPRAGHGALGSRRGFPGALVRPQALAGHDVHPLPPGGCRHGLRHPHQETVKRACPGPLAAGVGAPAHLDELCNTLILSNGECVSFRFSDLRKRDEFTKCINLLVTCTDV
ncbi:unnamed protein product, partial [Prorocentrum cordatum]